MKIGQFYEKSCKVFWEWNFWREVGVGVIFGED